MTNQASFVLQERKYFCLAGYRAILIRAQDMGYRISNFREFTAQRDARVLLLRHDLDHSIRSAGVIADLETTLAIRSTYFVQVTCSFYNILSQESRNLLKKIANQGHEIGLHYEAKRYSGVDGQKHLECDLHILADIVGQRIISASQHLPADSDLINIKSFIENEAYETRFTESPMCYISDSLMHWRQATPHDLLDQRRSFQLLTHPMKWAKDFKSMEDALDHALAEEQLALVEYYQTVKNYYRDLLQNREQLDALYRMRKAKRGHE